MQSPLPFDVQEPEDTCEICVSIRASLIPRSYVTLCRAFLAGTHGFPKKGDVPVWRSSKSLLMRILAFDNVRALRVPRLDSGSGATTTILGNWFWPKPLSVWGLNRLSCSNRSYQSLGLAVQSYTGS